MSKTVYCCPKHRNQVLAEEESGIVEMIIAERPMMCPKCKKAYYKWECVAKVIEKDEEK